MSNSLAVVRVKESVQRDRQALTTAVLRAGDILALPQAQLAEVLGVSAASVSRMKAGAYLLDQNRKEWELAALWVRVFRSLDSITGGKDEASRAWLYSENRALDGRPADMIRQVTGLVRVVDYLDASRGRI